MVFDNGAPFKGKLLSVFCANLGIRLIHTAVYHPQTNGKLKRAFRDDMRDFYRQYDEWLLAPLRRDLPAYVHYRNTIRGHYALGGKPSLTRLNETHGRTASQEVLDSLESRASYEVTRKRVSASGTIQLFGRDAQVGLMLANREVSFWESLEGLEARVDGTCITIRGNGRDAEIRCNSEDSFSFRFPLKREFQAVQGQQNFRKCSEPAIPMR